MSRMPGLALPANLNSFLASQREQATKQREQLGVEARSWYRITNQADGGDEAEILLYDEIGGWWGCTADELVAELRDITAPNIRVRINSPGGSVFEGIAIANALRAHPANIIVQVDGIAASIASVIAMAGDRVEMAPNTMLMIHDASGVCYGNATDMEEMGQLLDLLSDNIADAYAARAGGTRDEWRALMRAETWYLPEAAVEAGLADEATHTPQAGEPVEEPEPELEPELEPVEPEMRRRFDFGAYGYRGPEQQEQPAGDARQEPMTLTFNIGNSLGEQTITALLRAVAEQDAEPAAEEPAASADTAAADQPEPAAEEEPLAAPEDEWAAAVAHLTQDDADSWSALVSNVIEPDTSSSAATA